MAASDTTIGGAPTRICVAVVTRDRPEMLAFLLDSLVRLDRSPEFGWELLVVENGAGGSLTGVLGDFARRAPHIPVHYRHEPRLGLASARNAALEHALDEGFDRLAFVDDDEVVEPDWLIALHRELVTAAAHLAGGPVRVFVRQEPSTFHQKMIWQGCQARARRVEKRSALHKRRGTEGRIMLATNNWMTDLAFCRAHGVRFDMRYNLTGGEDSTFFRDAKLHGARTVWATDAVVWENAPLERLSIRYQFLRARDQSLVSFHRKYGGRPLAGWLRAPPSAAYKLVAGIGLLALTPFCGGGPLLGSIRAVGAAVGRVQGLLGSRTFHYRKTTGQ